MAKVALPILTGSPEVPMNEIEFRHPEFVLIKDYSLDGIFRTMGHGWDRYPELRHFGSCVLQTGKKIALLVTFSLIFSQLITRPLHL